MKKIIKLGLVLTGVAIVGFIGLVITGELLHEVDPKHR
jgi:preprotein translocase subunit Sss1